MHYILLISPPAFLLQINDDDETMFPRETWRFPPPGSSRDLQTLIAPSPVLEAAIFRRVVTQTT